jgi:hypothetical protein
MKAATIPPQGSNHQTNMLLNSTRSRHE